MIQFFSTLKGRNYLLPKAQLEPVAAKELDFMFVRNLSSPANNAFTLSTAGC
jgi:hypothetical protein